MARACPHDVSETLSARKRLGDPEWRRYGTTLLTGKLAGLGITLMIMAMVSGIFFAKVMAADTVVKAADVVNPVNTAWTLVAAFLVFGITLATFSVAMLVMYLVNLTGTLRVSAEGELYGLGLHEHGISAYPKYVISSLAAPSGLPKDITGTHASITAHFGAGAVASHGR